MIDFALDPQHAAEMPRRTSNVPGQYADWPHDGQDALTMEPPFPR
jgi:gamma-glutamyltranspeptidase/glutathione hydrolase